MTRYIVKRVLLAVVSVFIICAITFFAMNAIPGGPFNSEKALSEATKQVLEQRYNLDKPVPVQFVLYLRNLARGDFGVSLKTGRDIKGTLLSCFKVSARLGLTAAVLAVICGIVLGSLAALFRNGPIDRIIVFFTTLAGILHHIEGAAGLGRFEQVAYSACHRVKRLSDGLCHQAYQDVHAGFPGAGLYPHGARQGRSDDQGHL